MDIAYYPATVKAGFPSPALDYQEERIDLNKVYIPRPLSTFLVECSGDSMINAFIPPKARLIIDRSLIPQNGDVVLAVVNGEFTVKYFKKNHLKCWLVPANTKYREIEITADVDLQIWGVVTQVLSDPRDLHWMG